MAQPFSISGWPSSEAISAYADTVGIGTAAAVAILGEAGVANTGPSLIYGDVAGSTGTPAVKGFTSPPFRVRVRWKRRQWDTQQVSRTLVR